MKTHAISATLIGAGALTWAFNGRPLVANRDLDVPLNPFGINRSPYGEVFAMAMQSPIDIYFHAAESESHHHEDGHECETCDHDHDHDHEHSENENRRPEQPAIASLQDLIVSMDDAVKTRTNPKAATKAHRLHLRRQVEDKLRFAYNLDPAHYANYNSLHFFLTEPELGTRPELTPSAAKLAEETIQYCLRQDNDPRPALTAAAAATNILHLMFTDQKSEHPTFTPAQMRKVLGILDQCLIRYQIIADEWERTKNWERLSPMRIQECNDRLSFICRIRDAAEKTILRFEGKLHDSHASN